MICFPNAKINLGLNIVSKRVDGYHNLETIFYPIAIHDALEIIEQNVGEDHFVLEGIKIDGDVADNLVMKALRLLREHFSFPTLDVHLLKKIPFGAGIGGGSADAAFMLKLVNDTFSLGLSLDELASLAVKIGADCPFFVYNKPTYAQGIGEVLEPIDLDLSAYTLVLVKPDVHVSTRDAFALVKPEKPVMNLLDIVQKPIEEWRNCMANDFEKSVFVKYPEIAEVKIKLYDMGAVYTSMTGSGSSVLGLFANEIKDLQTLFSNCYVWQGKML